MPHVEIHTEELQENLDQNKLEWSIVICGEGVMQSTVCFQGKGIPEIRKVKGGVDDDEVIPDEMAGQDTVVKPQIRSAQA